MVTNRIQHSAGTPVKQGSGEAWLPGLDGGDSHGEAAHQSYERLPVHVSDGSGLYIGFSRLNQLRFIARGPILTGILKIVRLPPQSTW
jgi:hypothetical protein